MVHACMYDGSMLVPVPWRHVGGMLLLTLLATPCMYAIHDQGNRINSDVSGRKTLIYKAHDAALAYNYASHDAATASGYSHITVSDSIGGADLRCSSTVFGIRYILMVLH